MRERSVFGVTVFVLAACYTAGLPSALTECDSGEFVALALHGGIAHPPGYPLFTMLLRGVGAIAPDEHIVRALAALSATCVVGAAALMLRALRIVSPSPVARAVAVLVVGTAEPVWRAATAVEPFGLNLLLAGLVLDAAASHLLSPASRWPSVALGLGFGLGLCHHHSLALLAPFGAVVLLSDRAHFLNAVLRFAAGFCIGCLPLLYLVVEDKSGPYVWGDWSVLGVGLWDHLRRAQYGSFALVPGATGPWWGTPVHFGMTLGAHLSWLWVPPVAVGVGVLGVHRRHRKVAVGFGATALAMCWFFSLFRLGLPLDGDVRVVVERFFSLPYLLLAFPIVAAMDVAAARMKSMSVIAVAMVVPQIVNQAATSMRTHDDVYEASLLDVARAVGRGSVVITFSDADIMGVMYLRARGYPIDFVQVAMMNLPSYRAQVMATLWPEAPPRATVGDLVEHLLIQGKTVAMTQRPQDPEPFTESSFPLGPVIRLLPRGTTPPSPEVVYRWNVAFEAESATQARLNQAIPLDVWGAGRLQAFERTWLAIADALAAEGLDGKAADARQRAARLRAAREATR